MAAGDRDAAADALLAIIAADRDWNEGAARDAAAQAVRGGRARGSLGLGAAPAAVRDPVRMTDGRPATRACRSSRCRARCCSRGMHLPLHIFEPRYRAMVGDAMARDRRIGMIQPRARHRRPAAAVRHRLRRPDRRGRGARRRPLQSGAGGRRAVPRRARARRDDAVPPGRGGAAAGRPTDEHAVARRGARRSSWKSRALRRRAGLCVDWEAVGAARRREPGQRHRPDRAVRCRRQTGAAGSARHRRRAPS